MIYVSFKIKFHSKVTPHPVSAVSVVQTQRGAVTFHDTPDRKLEALNSRSNRAGADPIVGMPCSGGGMVSTKQRLVEKSRQRKSHKQAQVWAL